MCDVLNIISGEKAIPVTRPLFNLPKITVLCSQIALHFGTHTQSTLFLNLVNYFIVINYLILLSIIIINQLLLIVINH